MQQFEPILDESRRLLVNNVAKVVARGSGMISRAFMTSAAGLRAQAPGSAATSNARRIVSVPLRS